MEQLDKNLSKDLQDDENATKGTIPFVAALDLPHNIIWHSISKGWILIAVDDAGRAIALTYVPL